MTGLCQWQVTEVKCASSTPLTRKEFVCLHLYPFPLPECRFSFNQHKEQHVSHGFWAPSVLGPLWLSSEACGPFAE